MTCAAVWYAFEADGAMLGGRIVAQPCGAATFGTTWPSKQPRYCPGHQRQLAEVDRLGLAVPDPAAFPPAPPAEQAALL